MVKFIEYEESCSCGNGSSEVIQLLTSNTIITKAEFVEELDDYGGSVYHIHVLTFNNKINDVVKIMGYDNGYYGTGFDFMIEVMEDD